MKYLKDKKSRKFFRQAEFRRQQKRAMQSAVDSILAEEQKRIRFEHNLHKAHQFTIQI